MTIPGGGTSAPIGPITVKELPDSRSWSYENRRKECVRRFLVSGTAREAGNYPSILAHLVRTPLAEETGNQLTGFYYAGLLRRRIELDPVFVDDATDLGSTRSRWTATITYSSSERVAKDYDQDGGFSFDTDTGATVHLTQSFETVAAYAREGSVYGTDPNSNGFSDFAKQIGVSKDGDIAGVDIPGGSFDFSTTRYIPFADIAAHPEWLSNLYRLRNTVNNAPMPVLVANEKLTGRIVTLLFAKGELLYRGASGRQLGEGRLSVTFNFSGSPNEENIKVGYGNNLIANGEISKEGWEYLWTFYTLRDVPNFPGPISVPEAAYIERIYRYGDLYKLWPFTINHDFLGVN